MGYVLAWAVHGIWCNTPNTYRGTYMTNRITIKTLRTVCATLNRMTGSPMEPYVRDAKGQLKAQIGCYIIDCAYSGYQLARIMNEGGGQTAPLGLGFGTARECYDKIRAYMAGLQDAELPRTCTCGNSVVPGMSVCKRHWDAIVKDALQTSY